MLWLAGFIQRTPSVMCYVRDMKKKQSFHIIENLRFLTLLNKVLDKIAQNVRYLFCLLYCYPGFYSLNFVVLAFDSQTILMIFLQDMSCYVRFAALSDFQNRKVLFV